jgi:hypothetical protein
VVYKSKGHSQRATKLSGVNLTNVSLANVFKLPCLVQRFYKGILNPSREFYLLGKFSHRMDILVNNARGTGKNDFIKSSR